VGNGEATVAHVTHDATDTLASGTLASTACVDPDGLRTLLISRFVDFALVGFRRSPISDP
jgi:hypothetical protein